MDRYYGLNFTMDQNRIAIYPEASLDASAETVPGNSEMWIFLKTLDQTNCQGGGKRLTGSVVFDENDPIETGVQIWPLEAGSYQVFILRDVSPPYPVVASSAAFTITGAPDSPTMTPTRNPTNSPSEKATVPTKAPTGSPTSPTNSPTKAPSHAPTTRPTESQVCNAQSQEENPDNTHLVRLYFTPIWLCGRIFLTKYLLSIISQVPTDGAYINKIAFGSCNSNSNTGGSDLWAHVRSFCGNGDCIWNWLGDNVYMDTNDSLSKRNAYNAARNNGYYSTYGPVGTPKIPTTGINCLTSWLKQILLTALTFFAIRHFPYCQVLGTIMIMVSGKGDVCFSQRSFLFL